MTQKEIRTEQALGLVGQISKGENSYCSTIQCICVNDVRPGDLVFSYNTANNEVTNDARTNNKVFLGFVVRDKMTNSVNDTDVYPKGSVINVLLNGSIYLKADTEFKFGNYLSYSWASATGIASLTPITSSSSSMSPAWRVTQGGKSGDIIEITSI